MPAPAQLTCTVPRSVSTTRSPSRNGSPHAHAKLREYVLRGPSVVYFVVPWQ